MPHIVIAKDYGGVEVLDVVDVPITPIGVGEARVRIKAAGVNPLDWKLYSPDAYGGDQDKLPLRLGFEAAGVVVEVGEGAVGPAGPLSIDDEVIAFRVGGAYATEVTVAAAALLPKPSALSWEQAASLMLAGTTAMHAVRASDVRERDTLLVHAAAGGVGQMVVQIAVARGAHVIGTAAERDHDLLRRWGVEPVTFGDGLAERVRGAARDGVDAAIILVGTAEAVDVSTEFVPDPRRVVSTVGSDATTHHHVRVIGAPGPDHGEDIRMAARSELIQLVEQGQLEINVESTFALRDVAAAHRRSQNGDARGKLVLVNSAQSTDLPER